MALIIIVLLLFVVVIIWSARQKVEEDSVHQEYIKSKNAFESAHLQFVKENNVLTDEYKEWEQRSGADIYGYNIAGINFRGLNTSHLGRFSGTLRLEEDNPHDPDAVAIYRGRKKVGYIPRSSSAAVHDDLQKEGGEANCEGYIYIFFDEYGAEKFAGKIIIVPTQGSDKQ